MNDPILLFQDWLEQAERDSRVAHPRAFCLSTLEADGTPDARIVELKAVSASDFVFSTSLESGKARALTALADAALTFWWAPLERQVRVAGAASRVSDAEADELFGARSRDAQLASWASRTGRTLEAGALLDQQLSAVRARFSGAPVPRPEYWGAFRVTPRRLEFLRFQPNRLHERTLFVREGAGWRALLLQP